MTLAEAMTSLLFVAWLAAMSYGFTRSVLVGSGLMQARREAEQAQVIAVDVILHELRSASFSAAGLPVPGVRAAASDRIEVAADFNGDGDTDDANERVAYSYDAQKRILMRATGGASPQPFVRGVGEGGFGLRYFDGHGAEMGLSGMTSEARASIAAVEVRLQSDLSVVVPGGGPSQAATTRATVALRNR